MPFKDPAKRAEARRKWKQQNPLKVLEHGRRHDRKHRERKSVVTKLWREVNKEVLADDRKTKRQLDPSVRAKQRVYEARRRQEDPQYRIRRNLRDRTRTALMKGLGRKSASTLALIGCSWEYLMLHITSQFQTGMSWENYGLWELDHKQPCASFDLTIPEQQRVCFNWHNLQPLWKTDNRRKSDKLTT